MDPHEDQAHKADLAETVNLVLPFAFKLKAKMQARHLRRARTKCPQPGCEGTVHATLNGRKDHIHLGCDAPGCSVRMLE